MIVIITFVVGLCHFSHVVAGSVEILFLVASGEASLLKHLGEFLLPALVGNILWGVALVAASSHAQTISD